MNVFKTVDVNVGYRIEHSLISLELDIEDLRESSALKAKTYSLGHWDVVPMMMPNVTHSTCLWHPLMTKNSSICDACPEGIVLLHAVIDTYRILVFMSMHGKSVW